MAVNPAGFVLVMDGGAPSYIGGKAMEVISGGQFVFVSGASDAVSSGANSYAATDLTFSKAASGAQCTGVAVSNVESGADVTVCTRGTIIARANGTVTAGYVQTVDGNEAVANAGSVAANLSAQLPIGRAVTTATSGGYCILRLNL